MEVGTASRSILQPQAQAPRPKSPPPLSQQLSIREKLLFAQAVYKVGAANEKNWKAVGDLLASHPLVDGGVKRDREFWNFKACKQIYRELLSLANLPSPERLSGIEVPNAPPHLKLAQYFYKLRMEELKSEIEEQETQFRTLIQEIDTIKSSAYITVPTTTLAQSVILSIRELWNAKHPERKLGEEWIPTQEMVTGKVEEKDAKEPAETSQDEPAVADGIEASEAMVASPVVQESPAATPAPGHSGKPAAGGVRARKTPPPQSAAGQTVPPLQPQAQIPATRSGSAPSPLPLQVQPTSRKTSPSRGVPSAISTSPPKATETALATPGVSTSMSTSPPAGETAAAGNEPSATLEGQSLTSADAVKTEAVEVFPKAQLDAKVDDSVHSAQTGKEGQDVQMVDIENEEAAVDALAVDSVASPSVDGKVLEDDHDEEDVLMLRDKRSTKSRGVPPQTARVTRAVSRDTEKEEPITRAGRRGQKVDEVEGKSTTDKKQPSSRLSTGSAPETPRVSTRNRPSATPARSGKPAVEPVPEQVEETDSDNDLTPPPASPLPSDMEPPAMSPALPPPKPLGDIIERTRDKGREKPIRASVRGRRGVVEDSEAEEGDAAAAQVQRKAQRDESRSKGRARGRSDDTNESTPRVAESTGRPKRGREVTPIAEEPSEPKELRRSRRAAAADASDPIGDDRSEMDAHDDTPARRETRRGRPKRELTADEDDDEEEADESSPPKKKFKTSDDKRERDRQRYQRKKAADQVEKGKEKEQVQHHAGDDEGAATTARTKTRSAASEAATSAERPPQGRARRTTRANSPTDKGNQAILNQLWSQVSSHKYGSIFANPIKETDAPGYHEIVKKPMDLKTIKNKIKDGTIANLDDMQNAMLLMFTNALLYNDEDTPVYQMAKEMMDWSEGQFKEMRHLERLLSRS